MVLYFHFLKYIYNTALSVGVLHIHIDCSNNDLSTKWTVFYTISTFLATH